MLRTMSMAGAAAVWVLGAAGAASAGPSMSTKWSNSTHTLERCKDRAEDAVRDAGFRSVKVLQYSIFAERNEYSIMVRCIPDKGMVFFTVAGPRVERTTRYVDEVGDKY